MPYPKPDDPDYCPASLQPTDTSSGAKWHTCPSCGRQIATMGKLDVLFPHVSRPVPRFDRIKETLTRAGLNRPDLP